MALRDKICTVIIKRDTGKPPLAIQTKIRRQKFSSNMIAMDEN